MSELKYLKNALIFIHHHHHHPKVINHQHHHHNYIPTLSLPTQDPKLEDAYQKYAHRQRQKALILVNFSDLLLKVISNVIIITLYIVKVIVLLKVVCVLPLASIQELNQDACAYTPTKSRWPYSILLNTLCPQVSKFFSAIEYFKSQTPALPSSSCSSPWPSSSTSSLALSGGA